MTEVWQYMKKCHLQHCPCLYLPHAPPAESHCHHHHKLHSCMLVTNMNDVLVVFANDLWFVVTTCCTAVLPIPLLLSLPPL